MEQRQQFRRRRLTRWPGITSGQDAPGHRRQVRREQHLRSGGLLDLRRVAVVEEPVGHEVLVHRSELSGVLEPASCARHPAGRVHDDTGRFDGPRPDQRGQSQRSGGHVAARRGDQLCVNQVVAEQLGYAERELGQQVRCRVLVAVPPGVKTRVAQAEVGGQVHDPSHPLPQVGNELLRLAVGQGQEHDLQAVQLRGVEGGEAQLRIRRDQARVQLCHRGAGVRVSGGEADVEARVAGAEP